MAEAQDQAPKKDLTKMLTIGFMVINLLGLGAGAFLVFNATIGHESPSTNEATLANQLSDFRHSLQQEPVIVKLDTFNTNLDGIPRRLIRATVNLEMLNEEGFEEVITLGPQARDGIMKILNSKTFSDIETVQGKLHLKNEIISQVNSFLGNGVVRNVYFTDFAIQ
jgi:flagellar FliL protein